MIIAGSVLGSVLIICLFILWLKNKPERSFRRELGVTLRQLEKAIAPSLEIGCKRFIGDLTLSDIPRFSPFKLEQMLLSVKASKNDPYSPWLLQVDLQKEEAIFMANVLLAFSKKIDPAWYPQIFIQLNRLSGLIDEDIDYGSRQLNDISYWEDWWGKAKAKEEKQKIIREEEQFKKHMVKRADKVRLKGRIEMQNRIDNIVKDIRYEKGKEVIFVTKSIKNEPIRIMGEILEASVDQITFKTPTVLTIENVLCSETVLVKLGHFKNIMESKLLAGMRVFYVVDDVKILMDGSYEITVRCIKELDNLDEKAADDLINKHLGSSATT